MAMAPPVAFTAPQPPAPRFGLFSVATPRADIERIAFGVEIESEFCGVNHTVWRSTCPSGGEPVTGKGGDPWPGITNADAFQVYARPDCIAADPGQDGIRARITLDRTEEFQAERELQDLIVAAVGPAETLTSTEVSVTAALAMLECYLSETYTGGVGVIHAPRGVGAFAAAQRLIQYDRDRALTPLWTPWSFAGGMCTSIAPDGTPAAAGTAWLYATGQVFVWRGEAVTIGPEGHIDPATNRPAVLAERTYAVGYECVAAAAQVCLGAC